MLFICARDLSYPAVTISRRVLLLLLLLHVAHTVLPESGTGSEPALQLPWWGICGQFLRLRVQLGGGGELTSAPGGRVAIVVALLLLLERLIDRYSCSRLTSQPFTQRVRDL